MLHLGKAVEQVNNTMEYANTKRQRPSNDDDQLLNVGVRLRQLEENAVEKGEVGLVIALAKPFQRLIKYHLLFRKLLFCTDLATSKCQGVLEMVTKIERIARDTESERIQKNECLRVWDVLGRIDGLDKVERLAVPKPTRILLEECRTQVESRRTSKRLSDVVQPEGSSGIYGEKDLWLVVFNDVALRCQRIGTVSVTGWGASWTTSPKSENLYEFLKARFIARITLCYPTDKPSRLRRGMLTSLFERMEGLHLHNR